MKKYETFQPQIFMYKNVSINFLILNIELYDIVNKTISSSLNKNHISMFLTFL